MNTSGTLRNNSLNDLNIILELLGTAYTTTNLSEFTYENEINSKPAGTFILKDSGELASIGLQSGSYGTLIFSNSSDTSQGKSMALAIYLDDVDNIGKDDIWYSYRIKWSAGSPAQLSIRLGDVIKQSNSVDAIKRILELRGSLVSPISLTNKPLDTMNWILVKQNMWDQLETVVSKSFLSNDFLYWAWDDVNNRFKISSINNEVKNKDTNVFIRDNSSLNSTENVKEFLEKQDMYVWKYPTYKKFNTLGSSYKKLFPNVSFLGIPGGIINSGGIRKDNFITLMKAVGDTRIVDVLKEVNIPPENAIFGDLILRKHSINGHDLYSFADIYRDYKIATYAKVFVCQINNAIGPEIGTYSTIVNMLQSSNEGVAQKDDRFSDKYFLFKKIVEYKGTAKNKLGKDVAAATSFITTLFFVSDNYKDGNAHINTILEKFTGK